MLPSRRSGCSDQSVGDRRAEEERINHVSLGEAGSRTSGFLSARSLEAVLDVRSPRKPFDQDIIARFGGKRRMPREFFDDFVTVAEEVRVPLVPRTLRPLHPRVAVCEAATQPHPA